MNQDEPENGLLHLLCKILKCDEFLQSRAKKCDEFCKAAFAAAYLG